MSDTSFTPSTLFEKIAAKQIPSTTVYEDDIAYAFRDINPSAKVHVLIVPKVCGTLDRLYNATEDDKSTLGHLMLVAGKVARQLELGDGFRIVINDGPNGCQTVPHLHLHLIGGQQLSWPPGTGLPEGPKL